MLVAVADGFQHLTVIPGVDGVGVGEQNHQVNLVIGNTGVNLLMTALLVGQEQCYGQTGIVRNEPAGGCGGKQLVLCQYALIGGAKLHHQFLFLIVSQKCNIHIYAPPSLKLNRDTLPLNPFGNPSAGACSAFFRVAQQGLTKGGGKDHVGVLRHNA